MNEDMMKGIKLQSRLVILLGTCESYFDGLFSMHVQYDGDIYLLDPSGNYLLDFCWEDMKMTVTQNREVNSGIIQDMKFIVNDLGFNDK